MEIETKIKSKLTEIFQPVHLEVINESHNHHVPPNSETHFKVVVVSNTFEQVSLVKQHQLVNQALSHELANGVHALAIVTRTPIAWEKSQTTGKSPNCIS